MKRFNSHMRTNFLLRTVRTIVAFSLFLGGCESDNDEGVVVAAAFPASIELGTQQVVELRSLEPVFTEKKVTPVASSAGLILRTLKVVDDQTALATLICNDNTQIGLHHFELDFGDMTAIWDISVIALPDGPGTATISRSEATAGAKMAVFRVNGEDTHFDSAISFEVVGAPGMKIIGNEILSGSSIDVFFNIDITQEPTDAVVVLTDGAYRYEFPFTISAPDTYENRFAEQVLTRGQVGIVKFGGIGPTLYEGSRPATLPLAVEIGKPFDAPHGVSLAMRVPDNFTENELTFELYTWLNGGASLEVMATTVQVVSPSFIVPSPSVILAGAGEVTLAMKTRGINFSDVEALSLAENELLVMTSWSSDDAMATVISSAGALSDNYAMLATIGERAIDTQLTVVDSYDSNAAYPAISDVHAGDRLYVPVAVASNDLNPADITVTGTESIVVPEFTVVDNGTVVLDIQVATDVQTGGLGALQRLEINSNGRSHSFYLTVVESGVGAP